MSRTTLSTLACLFTLGIYLGSLATAQPAAKDSKAPAGQPEMKLPPGWTMEDMQACIAAGTPGEMHKRLAGEVGEWTGKLSMFMPGSNEPMKSECTSAVTKLMDGRFIKVEMKGDMPGMGPYHGVGVYGFDNVTGKFVSTWLDNHSTGIMTGTGELSKDGKTLTWTYTHSCPITKKPATMREVETETGPNTRTLEMFGADPKTGKEYKMMSIELTRK